MYRAILISPDETLIGQVFAVKNITSAKLKGNKYNYAFIVTSIKSNVVIAKPLIVDDFFNLL